MPHAPSALGRLVTAAKVATLDDLPADVREWLDDTYTPEGQAIWLASYVKGDDAHREHLTWLARCPSGGT